MTVLFQLLDPYAASPYVEWAIVAILVWQERRLRRVEERLNRLLGEQKGRYERNTHTPD